MWVLNHKESWALKNWCFRTVVLEKTLESLFDSKEIKPVNPKGNQPWIFIGRTDAEADAPLLWPLDGKSQLIGKDPDTAKDLGQEEKGVAEDEMVGWHHRLNVHEFEQLWEIVEDREAWQATVHGVTKSQRWQSTHTQVPLSFKDCSNSCPLRWWWDPTISSSITPFSSCLQAF